MNKRLRRVALKVERQRILKWGRCLEEQRQLKGGRWMMWGLVVVCLAGVVMMVVGVVRGWETPMFR